MCDDDPEICSIIAAILGRYGYQVKEVYDGLKVLEELKRGRYAVMILDYMLGKTNGLDVLQQAGQLDNKVRIILMSGYRSYDLPKRAQELGATGFLPKPFMIQELLHAVENSRRRA